MRLCLFFKGLGRATFLNTFFQYARFIAGQPELPGSIGEPTLDPNNSAMYSFLRLVGCGYFRAHASAFEQRSPEAFYHSIEATTPQQQHTQWLEAIRQGVWQRADSENQNMPSTEALQLHWRRCTWVLEMWHQATVNDIDLPGMQDGTPCNILL